MSTYTTITAVCGEVPGFVRGGAQITDAQITVWMGSIAQAINGAMLKRAVLPLKRASRCDAHPPWASRWLKIAMEDWVNTAT